MTTQTLEASVETVLTAPSYLELFGQPTTGVDLLTHVKSRYRQLQRQVHPDRFSEADLKQRATKAFARLSLLFDQAEGAIKRGTYGQTQLATIKTRRATHEVLAARGAGDLSQTYQTVTRLGGVERAGFMKVVSDPRNGDLLQREVAALKKLRGPDTNPKWHPYVSELLDSFQYSEPGKPRRQATVLAALEGFLSLEELSNRFHGALPAVHVVWIWRRLLAALGSSHDAGVVHGAVLPPHVMVLPDQHGVTLVDWSYSSLLDDRKFPPLVAIVDRYREWYPEEVFAKAAPTPATDIYLAAKTMIFLLGGDPVTGVLPGSVPKALRAYFKGCTLQSQAMRPQNAWQLFQEFDELLEAMGGQFFPRRFRPLIVPNQGL